MAQTTNVSRLLSLPVDNSENSMSHISLKPSSFVANKTPASFGRRKLGQISANTNTLQTPSSQARRKLGNLSNTPQQCGSLKKQKVDKLCLEPVSASACKPLAQDRKEKAKNVQALFEARAPVCGKPKSTHSTSIPSSQPHMPTLYEDVENYYPELPAPDEYVDLVNPLLDDEFIASMPLDTDEKENQIISEDDFLDMI